MKNAKRLISVCLLIALLGVLMCSNVLADDMDKLPKGNKCPRIDPTWLDNIKPDGPTRGFAIISVEEVTARTPVCGHCEQGMLVTYNEANSWGFVEQRVCQHGHVGYTDLKYERTRFVKETCNYCGWTRTVSQETDTKWECSY